MAVVKADAYGHGVKEVSLAAYDTGVRNFAVATPEEALELRSYIKDGVILILSGVERPAYEKLISADITVTVYTEEQILILDEEAKKLNKTAKAHLKIDTGMGRIGLRTDEELHCVLAALKRASNVNLTGMFTHFATADETDKSFTQKQFMRFLSAANAVKSAGFNVICHASNSAATIWQDKKMHLDMCRMGISMYGYPPSFDVDMKNCPVKPAMSLYSYITHIKTIMPGETVSYGRIFTAEKETKIATVAIGYADGYRRALSGKAIGFVNGKKVRQVGRVCMDQIMFDVTDVSANEGDEILLMGEGFNADDMAKISGTISYEILCGISKRVYRIYT